MIDRTEAVAIAVAALQSDSETETTGIIGQTPTEWVVGRTDGRDNLGLSVPFIDKKTGELRWYVMPADMAKFDEIEPA